MKKKINRQLVFVTALSIIATLLLTEVVFYNLFLRQVMDDLRVYANVLSSSYTGQRSQMLKNDNLRITIIKKDGTVLYDNFADASKMENHKDRPEVEEAFRKGEGRNVRASDTEGKNTFYYALKLPSGEVLRVAREADSIWSVFGRAVPAIAAIGVVLLSICALISKYLTKKILRPIAVMAEESERIFNEEEERQIIAYEEMTPFIHRIREQNQTIVKNAQMRQEFTANVSHELKTPLTAISGYAELIEMGVAQKEDVQRFAGEIERNSKRLLMLIDDIIQLSELDASEMEVTFEEVDLGEIAKNCVNMLQVKAQKHHVTLSYNGESNKLIANREMMEELVYNLCDNAIRYNKENGKVEVIVIGETHSVVLQVKDTGIGIPDDQQERVFERFYRVDKSRSKLTGGTGLGLAIVKHIIARHDAKLYMDSAEGVGTTIRVELKK